MTSGGRCVTICGTALMLLWSVISCNLQPLEVCSVYLSVCSHKCYEVNLDVIGGRAYHNAHFGAGSGPIFLDDVQCTSSSNQLLACPSKPILSHDCLHSSDAGVACESK